MTPRDPKATMNRQRFEALLEAYGADPTRWPEAERRAAETLLATDANAAQLLAAARMLDVTLGPREPLAAAPQLRARVLEIPIQHRRARARAGLGIWRFAVMALVPCVLGVVTGALTAEPSDQDDAWQEASTLALFSDPAEEDWP